jgi:hypothetical protein
MFRLIKWLVIIVILGSIALAITGYQIRGKTIQEHIRTVSEIKSVKTGIKDIRSLLGESLKAAGEAISEDVTDSEKEQLNDVLKSELKGGKPIDGAPDQKALPPKARVNEVQKHKQSGQWPQNR